ncbi:MAG: hypothetical protein LBI42_14695 [Chitinispirillales bacterium]|jgi:uncharacterized protein (TIGR02145 family)|nr:hypothetical protein [Chitinispirillales bacterium]
MKPVVKIAVFTKIVTLALLLTSSVTVSNCGGSASQTSVSPQTQTIQKTVPVTSSAPAVVHQDQLDLTLQDASTYFNTKIPEGTKLAVIAIKSDYPALSEYIIDGMLENLVNTSKFTVVDRQQLETIREELKFQMSGEVDDNSVQAIGRLTGAQSIVLGSAAPIGDTWRISIRALTVKNAEMIGIFNKNIPNAGIIAKFNLMPKNQAAVFASVPPVITSSQQEAKVVTPSGSSHVSSNGSDGGVSGNTMTDPRDGRKYRVVKIGDKVWMAENLNYDTGNKWCYENKESNCEKYGSLYSWSTAMLACPKGWHLPTRQEWNDLVKDAGGNLAGVQLKAKRPGWDGMDIHGFSALPGAYRNTDGTFHYVGGRGYWWSASEGGSGAYYRHMDSGSENVGEYTDSKGYGFSLRCAQD